MKTTQWYLRTQDETFGPETKERLIEWARMGRIQPGQEISPDGETWTPATEVPFLDMRWSIDIGDGTPRGPFNKHAAQALLASGRLPKASRLIETVPPFDATPDAGKAVSSSADVGRAVSSPADVGRAASSPADVGRAASPLAAAAEQKLGPPVNAQKDVRPADAAELEKARADLAAARREAAAARRDAAAARAEHASVLKALESLKDDQQTALAAKESELTKVQEAASAALAAKESELAAKDDALAKARQETSAALAAKATELAAKDDEIAKAQREASAAHVREAEYEAQVLSLSDEIKRLPANAKVAADAQTALYALMREEADDLAAALDAETRELEALRQYRQTRAERLIARRQEILKRIGTDAEDMTRRALKAHPDDPRTVHLRQELDALRVLQERAARESEAKIKDLSARLRERETELARLRRQTADITVIYRQLQDTREKLQRREKELVEERQKAAEERQHNAAAQQALLTRLSALEMGLPGATNQSREARSVRLAPWMGLKG